MDECRIQVFLRALETITGDGNLVEAYPDLALQARRLVDESQRPEITVPSSCPDGNLGDPPITWEEVCTMREKGSECLVINSFLCPTIACPRHVTRRELVLHDTSVGTGCV